TTALESALTQVFSPLAAVAFAVFVLLYTPCMVAIAAVRHEFGGRYALYQIIYTFAVAWVGAVIVYQGGTLLGLGG
ncbi:MAG: ferrous iron transporter B, partial [Anaerolineae bacterium]|nr:ferrous iron transporter B [Anaerolineae bacterium]